MARPLSCQVPPAFLFRATRYLDTAAAHPSGAVELSAALRRGYDFVLRRTRGVSSRGLESGRRHVGPDL